MSDRAYSAADIQVLTGLEPIRRRPGMYFGGVDATALHRMLCEVIDNAVGNHLEGTANRVDVSIAGHRVTVRDDGEGMPVELVRGTEMTVMEALVSTLHCGRRTGSGLAGVGIAAVNALCERFDVESSRGGQTYAIGFTRGEQTRPFKSLGPSDRTGTRIVLEPDFSILERQPWNREQIAGRLLDLAALNPDLILTLDGKRYCCPDGLSDLVRDTAKDPRAEPIRMYEDHAGQLQVDVAVLWTNERRTDVRGFVNQMPDRGVHVDTLRWGIVEAVRGLDDRLARVNAPALFEVLAPGLVAAISVELDNPRYATQARTWLDNPEVGIAVQSTVTAGLSEALARDHALRDRLLARIPR